MAIWKVNPSRSPHAVFVDMKGDAVQGIVGAPTMSRGLPRVNSNGLSSCVNVPVIQDLSRCIHVHPSEYMSK